MRLQIRAKDRGVKGIVVKVFTLIFGVAFLSACENDCDKLIKRLVKSPSTYNRVDKTGIRLKENDKERFKPTPYFLDIRNGKRIYTNGSLEYKEKYTFDSQNSFGALVRNTMYCYNFDDGASVVLKY